MAFTEEVYDKARRKSTRWPFRHYDGIRRFVLLQFEVARDRYCLLYPARPYYFSPLKS
jgi:hypothetical protein